MKGWKELASIVVDEMKAYVQQAIEQESAKVEKRYLAGR